MIFKLGELTGTQETRMSRVAAIAIVLLGTVVITAGGRGSVRADGGDPSLIHACVAPPVRSLEGRVRLVGAADACRAGETPVHWPGLASEPSEVAPRLVIRDANQAEVGTFAGLIDPSRGWAHVVVGTRAFSLMVTRTLLGYGGLSSIDFDAIDCEAGDGNPFVRTLSLSFALFGTESAFVPPVQTPPFRAYVTTRGEAPQDRTPLSTWDFEGCTNVSSAPIASVSLTRIDLNFTPPFILGLE